MKPTSMGALGPASAMAIGACLKDAFNKKESSEHTKNKRKSTKNKHEKGQKRKNQKKTDKKRQKDEWFSRK